MVGDRVFTDVLAGNRLGLYTVLVRPPRQDGSCSNDRVQQFERLARWLGAGGHDAQVVKVGTSWQRERLKHPRRKRFPGFQTALLNAWRGETALCSSHPGRSGWAVNGWAWSVARGLTGLQAAAIGQGI